VNLHTAQGARGSRSPGSTGPERAMRRLRRMIRALPGSRRAERLAGTTFALMIALAAIGWWAAPGDHTATHAVPDDGAPYRFTATTVPTGGLTSAAALILGMLILGAAAIGVLFFRPRERSASVNSSYVERNSRPPAAVTMPEGRRDESAVSAASPCPVVKPIGRGRPAIASACRRPVAVPVWDRRCLASGR